MTWLLTVYTCACSRASVAMAKWLKLNVASGSNVAGLDTFVMAEGGRTAAHEVSRVVVLMYRYVEMLEKSFRVGTRSASWCECQ